jgi:hypothetical protein
LGDDVVDQRPPLLVEVAGQPPPAVVAATDIEPGPCLLPLGVGQLLTIGIAVGPTQPSGLAAQVPLERLWRQAPATLRDLSVELYQPGLLGRAQPGQRPTNRVEVLRSSAARSGGPPGERQPVSDTGPLGPPLGLPGRHLTPAAHHVLRRHRPTTSLPGPGLTGETGQIPDQLAVPMVDVRRQRHQLTGRTRRQVGAIHPNLDRRQQSSHESNPKERM